MKTYIITLITIAIIDSAWLFSMGSKYKTWLGHLFADSVNFIPAVIFYLIYTFGIMFFVVSPALKQGTSLLNIFLYGALFGLVAYATYDLTNHATLKDWPLHVTLLDMAWGALLTGATSVIVVYITNLLK